VRAGPQHSICVIPNANAVSAAGRRRASRCSIAMPGAGTGRQHMVDSGPNGATRQCGLTSPRCRRLGCGPGRRDLAARHALADCGARGRGWTGVPP